MFNKLKIIIFKLSIISINIRLARLVKLARRRRILSRYEYPVEIINKEVTEYLKQKRSTTVIIPKQKLPETRFIVLHFVHRKADEFAYCLKQHVSYNLSQVEFNVAFKAPCTVGNLYPFKDTI